MTKSWSFHNPVNAVFGAGRLAELGARCPGDRVLVVTTAGASRRGLADRAAELIGRERTLIWDGAAPNPDLDDLDAATARFAGEGISCVVGLGGGSAVDAAKVLGVALPRRRADSNGPAPLERALRGDGGQEWTERLPVVAVPTTSGTGAEATPFATVWDNARGKKHSVAGDAVFPTSAILDPELTVSLPRFETLYSGLDAISHALETLWNRNRTPASAAFALRALESASDALPAVLDRPADLSARAAMQEAAFLAGLAISQSRTAIAHSMSYPLTLRYGVPHGLACSFTLRAIMALDEVRSALPAAHSALFARIDALLASLDLNAEIARYLTPAQELSLVGEMRTPARSDNFLLPATEELAAAILKETHR